MNPIAPCLWFDKQAEEAARFYTSLLPNSRIDAIIPYAAETPGGKVGETMLVEFTLAGQPYMGLNGGPYYKFNPAVSLVIGCADQAEVDRLWGLLGEGGAPVECGWITDRYGLSWQVVPQTLQAMIRDRDPVRARRVIEAVMQMVKLDIATLEAAYNGHG